MGIVRRSGIRRNFILKSRCITFQNNRAKYVCVFIHFTSSIIENIFMQPKMYCIVTLCHLNRLRKIRNWNPHLLFSSRSGTTRLRRLRFPAGRSTSGCHDSSSGSRCRRYSGHYRTVCPDLRKHPDRCSDRSHRRYFRSRQAPFWTGRPYWRWCRRSRSRLRL